MTVFCKYKIYKIEKLRKIGLQIMIRYKVSPLFCKNGYICTCIILCIELEDDIFNMIELFARDKTLRIFVSDRYC